jgi:hypothetical protein
MLSFVKQAAKLAAKKPSIFMKTDLRRESIRWSDIIVTHTYECDSEGKPKNIKIRRQQGSNRKCFSSESSAIHQDRKRIEKELSQHDQKLLPDLAACKLYKKSISELEAMQSNLIEELDSLRFVDPETGHLLETAEFVATEKKLMLVLEALDCISQRIYVESLLQSGDEKNKRRRESGVDKEEQNRMCFIAMFKRQLSDAALNTTVQ